MELSDYFALGAMAISVIAMWYAQRQAAAAEEANDIAYYANQLTKAANKRSVAADKRAIRAERRAVATEEAMAFRWQTIPNGASRYLLSNSGMRDAHEVKVVLPDFMTGVELRVQKMTPLQQMEFVAKVRPGFQTGPVTLPRLATVSWEDHSVDPPVQREYLTILPEQAVS